VFHFSTLKVNAKEGLVALQTDFGKPKNTVWGTLKKSMKIMLDVKW